MTNRFESRSVVTVWSSWIRAAVVEAVGWKANWSVKIRVGGGDWSEG